MLIVPKSDACVEGFELASELCLLACIWAIWASLYRHGNVQWQYDQGQRSLLVTTHMGLLWSSIEHLDANGDAAT
jgi:hypothetical protein